MTLEKSIQHSTLGMLRIPNFSDIESASQRIAPYVTRTPLLRSPILDELAGAPVWLKAENLQLTGAFKLRGAFNALLTLDEETRSRGVIAYSTGNHGQAIAYAANRLGIQATVIMPADAPKTKMDGVRRYGAIVHQYDRHTQSREEIGMQILQRTGATLIPPGDQPDVIAGQGTVIFEAWNQLQEEQRPTIRKILVPCGGGGLAAGTCIAMSSLAKETEIFAVEPFGFDDTVASLASGKREKITGNNQTLCDALMASIPAELPFAVNSAYLTGAVAVTDDEVKQAIRFAIDTLRLVIEPGGIVALAAILARKIQLNGEPALVVLSGGNIDTDILSSILAT
jgi:threonine dehydratase